MFSNKKDKIGSLCDKLVHKVSKNKDISFVVGRLRRQLNKNPSAESRIKQYLVDTSNENLYTKTEYVDDVVSVSQIEECISSEYLGSTPIDQCHSCLEYRNTIGTFEVQQLKVHDEFTPNYNIIVRMAEELELNINLAEIDKVTTAQYLKEKKTLLTTRKEADCDF